MEDNPSSVRMRERYENLYSGNFYERFVLGKWVQPQGACLSDVFQRKARVELLSGVQTIFGFLRLWNGQSMFGWGCGARLMELWYRLDE